MEKMTDWRGNEYEEEKLWYFGKDDTKVPLNCEICTEKQAVRNCCLAEGDIGRTHWRRTHWHGGIHTTDRRLLRLCKSCAEKDHAKRKK